MNWNDFKTMLREEHPLEILCYKTEIWPQILEMSKPLVEKAQGERGHSCALSPPYKYTYYQLLIYNPAINFNQRQHYFQRILAETSSPGLPHLAD